MSEKKIVLLISSSPFSTLNTYEALRASISIFEHQVTVIWRDKATHYTRDSVEKLMSKPFLRLAKDMEIELFVLENDLRKHGLDEAQLDSRIKSINYDDFISILESADYVMKF